MRLLAAFLLLLPLAATAATSSGSGSADLALQPPPVRLRPGAAYGPNTRIFQGIPTVERARNGRLWAAWYGGGNGEGPDNYVMLSSSADDGRTWSELELVVDPPGPIRAYDPCLWVDPTGRLWLFWAQAHTWWDGRGGVWALTADDPGSAHPTWSAPRRISDGVMLNKPTVLHHREWLLPVAFWSVPPKVDDPGARFAPGERSGANVVVSTDGGASWSLRGGARVPDRSFDEHMLVERRDFSLWMLVRTQRGIAESTSRDAGRTWSPGVPSAIPHLNSRFFVRRLRSGRLLLVRHNPPAGSTRRSHLTAYLSEDEGRTWNGGLLLDERAGVSYPDGVEAPDGTIRIIYDHDRSGAREILLARFTEADVLAGRPSSPACRLRLLVNRATGRQD